MVLQAIGFNLQSFVVYASPHEPISGAVDSEKKSWLLRIRLEFLAQAYQVSVHRACCGIALVAPDFFEQAIAAEHLARMADEVLQQLKLG
jgi:hypothetical protein